MRCRNWKPLLDGYLAGELTDEAQASLDMHLERCSRCSQYLMQRLDSGQGDIRLPDLPDPPGPDPRFVREVVLRTTGSSCAAARLELSRQIDGEDGETGPALLEHHLLNCRDCTAIRSVLIELRRELPRMAEAEPPSDFTSSVLLQTTWAPARPYWGRVVAGWVESILNRPLFPVEVAYVGSLVVLLFFNTLLPPTLPAEPVRVIVTNAESTIEAALSSFQQAWNEQLEELLPIADQGRRIVAGTSTSAEEWIEEGARQGSRRIETAKQNVAALKGRLREFFVGAGSNPENPDQSEGS